jgi:hypothetical protein
MARLVDAMDATCRGDTRLVVGLDQDDPARDEYEFDGRCVVIVKPGLHHRLVDWLNVLAGLTASRYKCVGHIGDDNVPRTVGWDVRVVESLRHHMFCFGNDLDPGRPPGSLSIHAFMRSTVIKKLGYMGPPQIQHMYVDPVWYAWGTATSIEFLEDVVLEHMHYSLGRAPMDESYHHSTGLIPQDCTNYNDYCDDGMNTDIEKLGGKPFSPEGMAEFNRKLNIPRKWS